MLQGLEPLFVDVYYEQVALVFGIAVAPDVRLLELDLV